MSGKDFRPPINVILSSALSTGPINPDVGEAVPDSVGWPVGDAVEGLSVGISVVGYVTGDLVGFI